MLDYLQKHGMNIISPDAYNVLNGKFNITKKQYYHIRRKQINRTPIPDMLKDLR